MKAKKIRELKRAAAGLLGEITPARVYTLEPDGKGGFVRKHIGSEEYRRRQAHPRTVRVAQIARQLYLQGDDRRAMGADQNC